MFFRLGLILVLVASFFGGTLSGSADPIDRLYSSSIQITNSRVWRVPSRVNAIEVFLWGGGGGGRNYDFSTRGSIRGGGGGSGGFCKGSFYRVESGEECQVTVGTGGRSGSSSDGRDGTASLFSCPSWGSVLYAKGGQGGRQGVGGEGGGYSESCDLGFEGNPGTVATGGSSLTLHDTIYVYGNGNGGDPGYSGYSGLVVIRYWAMNFKEDEMESKKKRIIGLIVGASILGSVFGALSVVLIICLFIWRRRTANLLPSAYVPLLPEGS
eukprot:TRINITY_DN7498_c0_g1_i1.p1 TRINITY_DN7498_c0_g1~~TRINITY_DN7498_c0_g1_i1.p1  ORF type:complete len:277 (-),score=51.17 TRINITY_DN7498_c0_g1_i1:166-969(-)